MRPKSARPFLSGTYTEGAVLDNLTILAIVIIVFWLGALAFYFYTSRQQRDIRSDLDALRTRLEELDENQD
jgi:hypothetical protein